MKCALSRNTRLVASISDVHLSVNSCYMAEIIIDGLEIVWIVTLLASVIIVTIDVLSAIDPDRDQDKATKRMLKAVFLFFASVISKVASFIA